VNLKLLCTTNQDMGPFVFLSIINMFTKRLRQKDQLIRKVIGGRD